MWDGNKYQNTGTYAQGAEGGSRYRVSQHGGCSVAYYSGHLCRCQAVWERLWAKPSHRLCPPHVALAILLGRSTCLQALSALRCCSMSQTYALAPSNNTLAISPQQGLDMALLIFLPSVGSKGYDFPFPHRWNWITQKQWNSVQWLKWMRNPGRQISVSSTILKEERDFPSNHSVRQEPQLAVWCRSLNPKPGIAWNRHRWLTANLMSLPLLLKSCLCPLVIFLLQIWGVATVLKF